MSFGSYVNLPNKNTNGSAAPSFRTKAEIVSYNRTDNSTISITVRVSMQYWGSKGRVGGGTNAGIYATISSGGRAKKLTIKQPTEYWSAIPTNKTYTVEDTLTVSSTVGGESITVGYSISNGGASWVTFASLTTQYTTISAPALLYTKCGEVGGMWVYNSNYVTSYTTDTINFYAATPGTGVTITGYEFQFSKDNFATIDETKNIPIASIGNSSGVLWYNHTFGYVGTGSSYYIRVRAMSSPSGYESDYYSITCVVNLPPTMNDITSSISKISYAGTSPITFNFSATDRDNLTITYHYRYYRAGSPSGNFSDTTNKSISINVSPQSFGGSGITFECYATDYFGIASNTKTKTVTFNTPPGSFSISKSSDITYTNKIKFNISTAANSDGDSSIKYLIYENGSHIDTITSSIYEKSISSKTPGQQLTYSVKAYDGYDYTDSNNSIKYIRSLLPNAPVLQTIKAEGKNIEIEPYSLSWANTGVDIIWNASNVSNEGQYPIQGYYIDYRYGSSGSSLTGWIQINALPINATSYTHRIDNITRGYYIYYRIRAIDSLGEISAASTEKAIQRSILPSIVKFNGNASSAANYNIWDNRDLNLLWRASSAGPGISYYKLKYVHNNKVYDLINNTIISSGNIYEGSQLPFESTDTSVDRVYTIPLTTPEHELATFIKNFFGDTTNLLARDGYFALIPYDVFDVNGAAAIYYLNLDTRNTPTLSNNNGDYTIKLYQKLESDEASTDYCDMVNFKEKISFVFPKPIDYNKEEKFNYYFGLYEATDKNSFTEEEKNNINLYRDFFVSEGYESEGKIYCDYTIPSTSINKIVSYCVTVKDSAGLVSETKVFPATLELCRYVDPSLSLTGSEWIHGQETDINGIKVYSSLLDNGGSLIDSARGLNYSDRRNLEKFPDNRSFRLFLEYSDNIDFINDDNHICKETEVKIYNDDDTSKEYYYQGKSWEPSIDIGFIKENEEFIMDSKKPWYIRLRLEVTKTAKDSRDNEVRTAYSSFVLLFADAPTLSGRRNGVGINISNPEGRFHVNPGNNEKKEIAIFGPEKSIANARRVIIDLRNGSFIAGYFDPGDLDE